MGRRGRRAAHALEHIETGRWPGPRALSEQVAELGTKYQRVLDFGTFLDRGCEGAGRGSAGRRSNSARREV